MEKKTSLFENGLIWFGAGVSIAEILTGTYFAPLGMAKGLAAILIGHVIGCVLLFLSGVIGGRLQKSAMETVKDSFGIHGGQLFAILNVLQLAGWTAIMIYDGALAAQGIFQAGQWIWCLLIGVLIIVWILIGITNLGKFNTVAMAALFILTLILAKVIFFNGTASVVQDEAMSFGAAVELAVAMPLSWLPPDVIIDPEHVLSSYAGVYLMQYETESQAKYAYAYYYGKSEFVDVDTVISVADGDNSANAAAPMAADENPIAELHEAVAENPVKAAGAVAVIDTGVNDMANVTESVSMIGDNTADENGHGTKMAQLIAEQNPDVSILSIKALGADGTGDVSAVYAAIQYAIDKKVSVINLSMSAVGTAENAALTSIIDAAVEAGIAVVGAKRLLEAMHLAQRRIDCLDYLVYQLEKEDPSLSSQ